MRLTLLYFDMKYFAGSALTVSCSGSKIVVPLVTYECNSTIAVKNCIIYDQQHVYSLFSVSADVLVRF